VDWETPSNEERYPTNGLENDSAKDVGDEVAEWQTGPGIFQSAKHLLPGDLVSLSKDLDISSLLDPNQCSVAYQRSFRFIWQSLL